MGPKIVEKLLMHVLLKFDKIVKGFLAYEMAFSIFFLLQSNKNTINSTNIPFARSA